MIWFLLLFTSAIVSYYLRRSLYAAGRGDGRAVRIVSMQPPAAPPGRPRFEEDLTFGDPTARRLRDSARSGDWRPLHAHLEGCRDGAQRELLVEALGEHELFRGREAVFEQWCAAHPESALPYLVRARWLISAAWAARGGGVAGTVDRQGWQSFYGLLERAEQDLARACDLDPTDPTPWALRLVSARGLQAGPDEARLRFEALVARDPHHRLGHAMRLTGLCRKWGGSHEAMFEFARQAAASAPAGSLLGGLIAQAHAERWMYAAGMAESAQDDPQWFGKASRYFQDPAVRQELIAAWDRSLGSPAFRDTPLAAQARNWFAFCFHQAGEKARARAALEPLGRRFLHVPWSWLGKGKGDTWRVASEARAACGLPPLEA